mmetsp:Transcript_13095/g.39400  ORF Transcript_13095/g.39400 Transcript_13095/m.39400 type:complete len:251 (+) Transcript_13095:465-1217(+)
MLVSSGRKPLVEEDGGLGPRSRLRLRAESVGVPRSERLDEDPLPRSVGFCIHCLPPATVPAVHQVLFNSNAPTQHGALEPGRYHAVELFVRSPLPRTIPAVQHRVHQRGIRVTVSKRSGRTGEPQRFLREDEFGGWLGHLFSVVPQSGCGCRGCRRKNAARPLSASKSCYRSRHNVDRVCCHSCSCFSGHIDRMLCHGRLLSLWCPCHSTKRWWLLPLEVGPFCRRWCCWRLKLGRRCALCSPIFVHISG